MTRRAGVFLTTFTMAAGASADTITFDDFVHGQILTNQIPGVTISAENPTGPDIAAVFDTNSEATADPDLQRNDGPRTGWASGNLDPQTDLGGVLFISENSSQSGGVLTDPDDEGSRPAGDLTFKFFRPVNSFGFDLVDVEDVTNELGSVEFFDMEESFLTVSFLDFLSLPDPAVFGNASANRIPEIPLARSATKVVIHMGGSGAVDNVSFSTPEPGTLVLLAAGLVGMAFATRRRRGRRR